MSSHTKYTSQQIRAAIKSKVNPFEGFLTDFINEANDVKLYRNVNALLLKLYEWHLDGRKMTKTQACNYIPAAHAATCMKYVVRAHEEGYLNFETDVNDRRKSYVVPTKHLIEFVEEKISSAIDEMRIVLGSIATVEPLPKDNLPLNGHRGNG